MDFVPSHRLASRLCSGPTQDNLAQTLPIPVFIAVERLAGVRQFARCAFDGFHEPEQVREHRYIWTRETSTIDCYFTELTKLRYIWLEIANTGPAGSEIALTWDGQTVISKRIVRGRTTVCGRLPDSVVLKQLTLRLETSTFVPDQSGCTPGDTRELGIALRAIVFGKRWTKYRAGSFFQPTLPKRLEGFTRPFRRRRAA